MTAPGEPPNNDSGSLANGIEVSPPIDNRGEIEVRVTSNAPYSAALEDGSSRSAGASSRSFAGKTSPYGPNKAKQGPVKVEFGDSTTAARPFMRPARDAKKREARKRFAQQVEKIVQGAAD